MSLNAFKYMEAVLHQCEINSNRDAIVNLSNQFTAVQEAVRL